MIIIYSYRKYSLLNKLKMRLAFDNSIENDKFVYDPPSDDFIDSELFPDTVEEDEAESLHNNWINEDDFLQFQLQCILRF